MEALVGIIRYTFKQHTRSKIFLAIILFGLILILGGLVVSSIALDERMRFLLDIGLAGIEFLALVTVIYATVNLVLEEMESRTIYLILAHPIKRSHYIVGRYIGTLLSVVVGMAAMAILHVIGLYLIGWHWQFFYLVAVGLSVLKIMVMSALALFFSLFSTSAAASMVFTIFVWLLGHFSEELRYVGERSNIVLVKLVVWVLYHLTPNLAYFNYRDFWASATQPPLTWFVWIVLYSAAYIGSCLYIAHFLFSQKEF